MMRTGNETEESECRKKARLDENKDNKLENDIEDEDEESDEQESDEQESDDEVPEIGLDQFGRIVPGPIGPMKYDFQAFENCVDLSCIPFEILVSDFETVFTAREVEAKYSAGETYFIHANETPRCALEKMALNIFQTHTENGIKFDASKSGAEWWTLVIEDESDVGLHWDKDYNLEDYGVNVFPHLGTVTYFSDIGGPTMVLEKVAPPQTSVIVSGKCGPKAYVSKPKIGNHIIFDGRYLHYASNDLNMLYSSEMEGKSTTGSKCSSKKSKKIRISFLVNIWLNHHPKDAQRLPNKICKKLNVDMDLKIWNKSIKSNPSTPKVIDCFKENVEVKIYEMNVLEDNPPVKVKIPLPKLKETKLDEDAGEDNNFRIIHYKDESVQPLISK